MIITRLNESEIQQAAFVGMQRCAYAISHFKEISGYENKWQREIEGALAEFAFAKLMDIHWDGKIGVVGKGDVGSWEVRHTHNQDGHLLLQPGDLNHASFVLLTGQAGLYTVRGWIMGRDGKLKEYWADKANTGRPCFWVPQSDLLPMERHSAFPNSSYKEIA
jgi:hypothetical protein